MRARLFEPFFTTKDVGAGTGLGLALVLGLAQAHGARVDAANRPAGGAQFTITFPATAVAPKRRCQSAVSRVPHHCANSGWRRTRVGASISGKWLTSTVGRSAGSSASRRAVAATRAWHHASRDG